MINVPIFQSELVQNLYDKVEKNLDLYEAACFDEKLSQQQFIPFQKELKHCQFSADKLIGLEAKSKGTSDVENAYRVFQCFEGMTPYLASDERIWVALIHKHCLKFVWDRHIKSGKDKEARAKLIRAHMFCRGGLRGIHRNNTLSSLWWWGYVASQYKKSDLKQALKILCSKTDLREQILGRPTLSRVLPAFNSVMDVVSDQLASSNKKTEAHILKRTVYREWFKEINRHGGVKLYANMTEKQLYSVFTNLLPRQ